MGTRVQVLSLGQTQTKIWAWAKTHVGLARIQSTDNPTLISPLFSLEQFRKDIIHL